MKVLVLALALLLVLLVQREPFRIRGPRKIVLPATETKIRSWKGMI
jgi:hypothetical protein